jgi:hypothetical protein
VGLVLISMFEGCLLNLLRLKFSKINELGRIGAASMIQIGVSEEYHCV